LWSALEWLARYPYETDEASPHPPLVGDAIAVVASDSPGIEDAIETIKQRGGSARAWVVGDAELDVDVPTQRTGLNWPL
jgi:hypothetical protein